MMSMTSAGEKLHKEMQLSFEPVRMVNMKRVAAASEKMSTHPTAAAGAPGVDCLGAHSTCAAALQILELSNLDQLYDYYNSVALFYDVHQSSRHTASHDDDRDRNGAAADVHDTPVKKLQSALEELLVHQPAAAGRICRFAADDSEAAGRLRIEYYSSPQSCHTAGHDKHELHGVPFVVAHADIALSELGDVSHPHPSLDVLYPTIPEACQDRNGKYLPRPVMALQVTTFTCSSFCLAHMNSHAFMDGQAGATFLQNMCSIARGAGLTVLPNDLSSRREIMKPRLPPYSPSSMEDNTCIQTRKREEQPAQLPYSCATRFAFSTAALEALRQKASCSAGQAKAGKPCSRYQALAALLWIARAKSLYRARSSTPCTPANQELNLYVPTNLRERGIPKLTREYTGNAIFQFRVSATVQELCESSLPSVAHKIKFVLEAGMDNLAECAQSQIDYIESQLRAGLVPYLDNSCLIMPSLVSLPFYDTDCGWGRPVYCARPSKQLAQRLIVLDHPAAGAWNVLAVFNSQDEHAAFKQEIAEYIIKNQDS